MSINTSKLLPSSIKVAQNNFQSSSEDTKLKKPLISILKKTIKIESILKNTNSILKKEKETNRKNIETQKFLNREKKLEKKKNKNKLGLEEKKSFGSSIFDRIRKFFLFTFLGWLVKNYFKYVPQILDFGKKLKPVIDFFESFTGNLFNGIIDFIGKGYELYDRFNSWTKEIGGEPFQEAFNNFSKNLNTFVNLAIIAGLLSIGGESNKGKTKPTRGGGNRQPSKNEQLRKYLNRKPEVKNIEKKFGNNAARYYEELRASGKNSSQAFKEVKRKLKKRNLFNRQNNSGLSSKGKPAGKITGRGFGKIASRTTTKFLGKTGSKIAGKVLGRIPIIGGLVDFLFALWSGEKPARAAAKAVGATIGSALGTFIPIPFAGTILGGILGDIVGGALYDTLIGNSKPKKKAKGGQITRGGKAVNTSIQRTIVQKRTKLISPPLSRPKPGESVGGEKRYKEMFPEPLGENAAEYQNPFGFLYRSSNLVSDIPYIGPIFSIFGKLILGESPKNTDYKNIGYGLKAWINNALLDKTLTANTIDKLLNQIPFWVEKSSKILIEKVSAKIIDDLKRNLSLKKMTSGDGSLGDLGEGLGVYVSSDSPDFWLLATAAMFENSDPQGAADVAQVIYNRVSMPGDPWKVNNSISKAILNPDQFRPVRQYGGTSAWSRIKTKNDAIRFARSHGKTQQQLETVAAALLDKDRQNSARQFVGPRDNFRAEAYEKRVDYLADDTEKTRHGHTFGFEPRGATIGAFRAGKLSAAQVSDTITGEVNEWRFGLTGRTYMQVPGWSHAHFEIFNGNTNTFIKDMIPLLKKIASRGLKPELSDGTRILPGQEDKYYEELIRMGMSRHTHSGRKIALDVNMPGFPLVPFNLSNFQNDPGGGGNYATVPGSGKTVLMHMSKKPDGKKGGGTVTLGQNKIKDRSLLKTRTEYESSSIIFIKPIKEVVYIPINNGRSNVTFLSSDNTINQNKSTLFVR